MPDRKIFVDSIRGQIGKPYIWGGQDERGYDCSGIIMWGLRCAGFQLNDMSAMGIYEHFHPNKVLPAAAPIGSIYCYWSESRNTIGHVMACLAVWDSGARVLVGARGGGATTHTQEAARAQNAFVDVVLDTYQEKLLAMVVDPFRGM